MQGNRIEGYEIVKFLPSIPPIPVAAWDDKASDPEQEEPN